MMRQRRTSDTELLLEVVGEAYSLRDVSQFRSGVLELLGRLVRYDSAGFNEVGPQETFALTTFEIRPGYNRCSYVKG